MSLLSDLLCAQCLLSQMQVHDSAQATISEVMHKARLAFDFMCLHWAEGTAVRGS